MEWSFGSDPLSFDSRAHIIVEMARRPCQHCDELRFPGRAEIRLNCSRCREGCCIKCAPPERYHICRDCESWDHSCEELRVIPFDEWEGKHGVRQWFYVTPRYRHTSATQTDVTSPSPLFLEAQQTRMQQQLARDGYQPTDEDAEVLTTTDKDAEEASPEHTPRAALAL